MFPLLYARSDGGIGPISCSPNPGNRRRVPSGRLQAWPFRQGFLLHCQTATGSCTSAAVLPTPAKAWQVVVGADAWVLDTAAFERAFDLAVDASTIVSFCLASSHAAPDALLDLQVHV